MTFTERYRELICDHVSWIRVIAMIEVVLLILLLFSTPYGRPESGTFVISVVSGVVILLTLVPLTAVLLWCRRHRLREEAL